MNLNSEYQGRFPYLLHIINTKIIKCQIQRNSQTYYMKSNPSYTQRYKWLSKLFVFLHGSNLKRKAKQNRKLMFTERKAEYKLKKFSHDIM